MHDNTQANVCNQHARAHKHTRRISRDYKTVQVCIHMCVLPWREKLWLLVGSQQAGTRSNVGRLKHGRVWLLVKPQWKKLAQDSSGGLLVKPLPRLACQASPVPMKLAQDPHARLVKPQRSCGWPTRCDSKGNQELQQSSDFQEELTGPKVTAIVR